MKLLPTNSWMIGLLSGLLLFASCKASKKGQTTTDNTALSTQTAEILFDKLADHKVAIKWLDAKAKINFRDATTTQKFNATIRMRTDSLIWMNIKKLSVEGARVLVDKDSVYILNRLDKEYYVRGLDFLEETYHLPADFNALQTMLLGNPYFFENHTYIVNNKDNQYKISSEKGPNTLSDYWLNGTNYLLEQMAFLDLRNSRKLVVGYEDYQAINEKNNFAHKRNFLMQSDETGEVTVNIQLSKVTVDVPKSMPFSVSSRYKRVD